MRRSTLLIGLWLAALTVPARGATTTSMPAAAPTTAPAEADLERWWADLAAAEPAASRALLKFAAAPDAAVSFIKAHLKPLKLTPDELQPLLAELGSDDETVWKTAYETLDYLDPRLAMDLVSLMELVTDPVARERLVALVCAFPVGTHAGGGAITLTPSGPQESYNFSNGTMSWWAEVRIDRLNASQWATTKPKWTRAVRAIALLQQIDTPAARAIVTDVATGHPDALPTNVAKDPAFGATPKSPGG